MLIFCSVTMWRTVITKRLLELVLNQSLFMVKYRMPVNKNMGAGYKDIVTTHHRGGHHCTTPTLFF